MVRYGLNLGDISELTKLVKDLNSCKRRVLWLLETCAQISLRAIEVDGNENVIKEYISLFVT
jgi:hypothetical protein